MIGSFRNYLSTAGVAILMVAFFFFTPAAFPFLRDIDVRGRDIFFRLQTAFFQAPIEADNILLVNLDDETLRRLETRWPFPRSLYGEALARIMPYSPRAVGFDLIFSGDDFFAESDIAFSDALKAAGNVVIASHQGLDGEVGPAPLIRGSAWKVGIVDKPRDRDRVLRRALLTFPVSGKLLSSWELALFEKAFPAASTDQFPIGEGAVINYQLRFSEFPQVSFWRLLEGSVLDKQIRNKIILFGLTAETFHDIHATPLGTMPGVAINANVLVMLMSNGFFTFAPKWAIAILAFLSFWLILISALSAAFVTALITITCLIGFYLGVSFMLFYFQVLMDVWLLAVLMVLTLIGAFLVREGQLFFENLKLREEAARDPLTGFYNRRFLSLKLKSELKRLVLKYGMSMNRWEVSVVMLDLDNFKLVNDSFGHAEGDRVLSVMAEAIRSSVRKGELICRYGGDEFCIILPEISIQNAARFAEKVRKIIESNPDLAYKTADNVSTIRVTASIGVASVSGAKAMDPDKLIKAADRALYRAKAAGRNQVCVFDPTRDVIS